MIEFTLKFGGREWKAALNEGQILLLVPFCEQIKGFKTGVAYEDYQLKIYCQVLAIALRHNYGEIDVMEIISIGEIDKAVFEVLKITNDFWKIRKRKKYNV